MLENPSWPLTRALLLAGSGNVAQLEQLEDKLPTAAAATLSFDGPWARLAAGTARLDDLFLPRPTR